MNDPASIEQITQSIELGFLEFIASHVGDGFEIIRDAHPVRTGASMTLRNRVAVDFIIEVEAIWEPSTGQEVG